MNKKTLALLLAAITAFSAGACNLINPDNGGEKPSDGGKVATISASLLDGKVANLLAAEGIGIQDKNEQAQPRTSGGVMVAYADDGETSVQAKNELVKQTGNGVKDVHFHDGAHGTYKDWNNGLHKGHYHNGKACEVEGDCFEPSDETLDREQTEAQTVVSLGARVNKLYSTDKFTFMSTSSAVEGNVQVFTQSIKMQKEQMMQAYLGGTFPTYLNVEEHYRNETQGDFCYSWIDVKSVDGKSGKILVRRSEHEKGYHYSNYWSDDFNQSFIIDNATGITYSLAQIPYIYSVQNGVLQVFNTNSTMGRVLFDYYVPEIENGELKLNKLELNNEDSAYAINPIVDIYGNIVFFNSGATIPNGEIKRDKYIVAGLNQELMQYYETDRNPLNRIYVQSYKQSQRYLLGSDGKIYRINFTGKMLEVSVNVLDENCTWQNVPENTDITFNVRGEFFANISLNMAVWQYLRINKIQGGKIYLANALLGSQERFTINTDRKYIPEDGFLGVAAIPVNGGSDAAIVDYTNNGAGATAKGAQVMSVGKTAFAYVDGNKIVIWDRLTDTKKEIDGAAEGRLLQPVNSVCFMANTASGTYYVRYDETNPTKEWSEYSKTLIEQEIVLDAYYELLLNK